MTPNLHNLNLDALTRKQQLVLLTELLAKLIAPPEAPPVALLSAEQLAQRWAVPASWVLERHRAGHLQGQRLGHYVRFSEAAIADFLASDHAKSITAPPRGLRVHRNGRSTPKSGDC